MAEERGAPGRGPGRFLGSLRDALAAASKEETRPDPAQKGAIAPPAPTPAAPQAPGTEGGGEGNPGAFMDDLTGVAAGDGTFLNTREWKYASFFNRVKQSVGMHWNPNQQLQRRDPTGGTYSGKDRYTLLNVVLDERGNVTDVTVQKSSGLDFLDMEAIASFQKAQPFPNPPSGLLDGDSRVKFQFGFFLEMGGGPRMRLFRQAN